MKWFIAPALFLISSCSPKFKVGDCIMVDIEKEKWESPTIQRIEEMGEKSYRTAYYSDEYGFMENRPNSLRFTSSFYYKLTECPK